MPVGLYLDVHVPQAIAEQLLRRDVSVITALQDEATLSNDEQLLDRSSELGRVIVTFDVRFKAMAEEWQRRGRPFSGLIYSHPLRTSIGKLVQDLELIAKVTEPDDWKNVVERLPL